MENQHAALPGQPIRQGVLQQPLYVPLFIADVGLQLLARRDPRLVDSLALRATFTWTDSEYTDFKLAANAAFFGGTALTGYNAKGNTQPRFPELSGTLSATWTAARSASASATTSDRVGAWIAET